MIGTTLGHYRVVEKIGEGGMGVVYRAHDERLDRDVAIKVLPEEVATDPDRLRRFEREAKAVAKLSHPNILAIHELSSHEGVPFIVTELLEGESLREVIEGRRLTSERAIEYATQIANGLAAAHARDIVHRDLKPGNVFVTSDGVVKILDFGLAKLKHPETEGPPGTESLTLTKQTDPGKVLGTVGYISPEQVRAEQTDHRSDIFSLGIVLYEMLAGQRPFRGASSAEIMTAIARENQPRLSQLEPEIQPPLERVVSRCLEKRPEDRFQSARDLAFDLQGIRSDSDARSEATGVSASRRSSRAILLGAVAAAVVIGVLAVAVLQREPQSSEEARAVQRSNRLVAVLPFENLTGDPSLDHLGPMVAKQIADGLTETEVAEVVPAMTLRAATENEGTTDTPPSLARATGSGTIVSGSYALQDDGLTLGATVMDAAQERLLYTLESRQETGEAPADPVARLRERVMAAVAAHLSRDIYLQVTNEPPLWAAYREYLLSVDVWNEDIPAAIHHLERAVELDPEFLGARMKLCAAYWNLGEWATADSKLEPVRQAKARLNSSGRNRLAAFEARVRGNLQERLRYFREALRLDPNDRNAAYGVANYAQKTNRPREALEIIDNTDITVNMTIMYLWIKCEAHHMLGEYQQELETTRQWRERYPDSLRSLARVAGALAALGRLDDLDRLIDESSSVADESDVETNPITAGEVMTIAASELRAHGFRDESLDMINRAVQWHRSLALERAAEDRYREGLASALYAAEHWDEAKALFEELVQRKVERVDTSDDLAMMHRQGYLGTLAARTGDRGTAVRISDELASVTGYTQGWNTYWRACIAAQLGDKDGAVELLRRAFADGRQLELSIHRDIDLEPLWDYPPFQELMRPKG